MTRTRLRLTLLLLALLAGCKNDAASADPGKDVASMQEVAEAAAQEFLTKFPDHPEAQQMRALLADLEQARTVNVDRNKIGVILPLSSPRQREWVSEVGQTALQGIQVAFAREGFSPLKMEVRDSRANLATTAAAVEELATVQRVIAILGPLFNDVAQVDWSEHLPKLTAFWSRALLGIEGYHGNPFRSHSEIHARSPFTVAHFQRWLLLFHETIELGWVGPNATRALELAHNVARVHSQQLIGTPVDA